MTPALLIHTVRHLEPTQVAYLAFRPLRRALGRTRYRGIVGRAVEDRLAALQTALCQSGVGADAVLGMADRVVAGEVSFLGESRSLSEVHWGRRNGTPLWSFHLQYGEHVENLARAFALTGERLYARRLVEFVTAWIEAEKPVGSDPWAPYAVSRRLLHWTRAFLLCRSALPSEFIGRWIQSIAEQTVYLAHNIEWHLLGNHVQKNLHAVYCAAAILDGRIFVQLRERSARLLAVELDRQVLADGMHYERSPLYHAEVLRDCREALGVARLARTTDGSATAHTRLAAVLQATIDPMVDALCHFVRPDGTLHLFNDAANVATVPPASLLRGRGSTDCGSSADGTWSLPEAGYFGWRGAGWRFIVDCGEPGPRHQPAHGHCDLLSYELDVAGNPFIVDSGTSGYDGDSLRQYVRSTEAHNTVQIGGRQQHELWGTFRMARRATVRHAYLASGRFEGAYSPFFSRSTVHERVITWRPDRFTVDDRVRRRDGAPLEGFIHFHPDIDVRVEGNCAFATRGGICVSIVFANVADVRIVRGSRYPTQGWYAPVFGVRTPAPVIVYRAADADEAFGYELRLPPDSTTS